MKGGVSGFYIGFPSGRIYDRRFVKRRSERRLEGAVAQTWSLVAAFSATTSPLAPSSLSTSHHLQTRGPSAPAGWRDQLPGSFGNAADDFRYEYLAQKKKRKKEKTLKVGLLHRSEMIRFANVGLEDGFRMFDGCTRAVFGM